MSNKNKNKKKKKPSSAKAKQPQQQKQQPRNGSEGKPSEEHKAPTEAATGSEQSSSGSSGLAPGETTAATPQDEELDEAQRAGQRRPEPAPDIGVIFPIKETDDILVRSFKQLLQGIVDRWRVLVVFGVIGLVIVLAVAITLGERRADRERAWDQYLSMQTIAELEMLTEGHRGQETLPWIYLRLIERLDERSRGEGDRQRALERLSTRIDEFLRIAGDDPRFAADVRRLQTRRAQAQRDLEVLQRIAEREDEDEDEAKADRPRASVFEPVFDAEGARYEDLPNPIVVFETEDGTELRFELYEDRVPNTVANLIWLINQGYYDYDGPGGYIETDGPSTDPQQRLFGRFVAKDEAQRELEEMLEGDRPMDLRVQRLDERWHDVFPQRSVGYTIPFEDAGAREAVLDEFGDVVERRVRRVRPGDLVMDMEPPTRERVAAGIPMPGTAEGAFRVVRSRVPQYHGRYVIFGRIADEESAEALDQLPEETALRRAWAESLRPKLVPRTVALRPEMTLPSVEELAERFDGDLERAEEYRDRVASVLERLENPAFVERTRRGVLRRVAEPVEAHYLALHPAQLEAIPAGEGYRDAAGDVHSSAPEEQDEPSFIDWFKGQQELIEAHRVGALVPLETQPSHRGALFPGVYDEEAIRLLPPTRPVYDAEGELVAREYRPMVRYFYYETLDAMEMGFMGDIIRFPALMPAQETPPDRLPIIDLFPTMPTMRPPR